MLRLLGILLVVGFVTATNPPLERRRPSIQRQFPEFPGVELPTLPTLPPFDFTIPVEEAIVVLTGNATGSVRFTETTDGIEINGQVTGLSPGLHGFHIHALGDLSNGCASTGAHFNPYNQTHGAPNATVRHVGDLGNILADNDGVANVTLVDNLIALSGDLSIIGRAVVVHAGEDDLGLGGNDESLATGNAGARVACGIIGRLSESPSPSSLGVPLRTSGLLVGFFLALIILKN